VAHPKIVEDLFTQDTFTDCELVFDWKISPAGNSGVKYRIQDRLYVKQERGAKFEDTLNASFNPRLGRTATGQDYVVGFEFQLELRPYLRIVVVSTMPILLQRDKLSCNRLKCISGLTILFRWRSSRGAL
jgi:hypothetical protein